MVNQSFEKDVQMQHNRTSDTQLLDTNPSGIEAATNGRKRMEHSNQQHEAKQQ